MAHSGKIQWSTRSVRIALMLVLAGMVAACSATYTHHGWIPEDEELSAIIVGVDTRDSVEAQIGKPNANGVLRDNAWYYTNQRVRKWAYKAPETIERELLAISFTPDGTVDNIERFGLEDGQVVTLSRRVTETSIREFGLIQQLLRNFGQINVGEVIAGN